MYSEPVFVNLLRSPGIDSLPGGPVRQPYSSYWPGRLHRLAESISRNRILGSINVYKHGLWRGGKTNRVVVPTCQAGNRFLGSLEGLQIRAQASGQIFQDDVNCIPSRNTEEQNNGYIILNGFSSTSEICFMVMLMPLTPSSKPGSHGGPLTVTLQYNYAHFLCR